MLASFTSDADGSASAPGDEPAVEDILHWTMAVTLNVISGAAFSLRMSWPTRSVVAKEKQSRTDTVEQQTTGSIFSKSHTIKFPANINVIINHTPKLILLPK